MTARVRVGARRALDGDVARCALILLGALGAACETREHRETRALVATIEFARRPGASDAAAAEALRALPCTAPDVCRARDACALASELLVEATQVKDDVKSGLDKVEHGTLARDSLEAQTLPMKLETAERLVQDSLDQLHECERLTGELRRRL